MPDNVVRSASALAGSAHADSSGGVARHGVIVAFSFPVLLAVLLAAAVFFASPTQKKGDSLFSEGDTWWHIRTGDEILRTHQFPQTDTYSWTAAGTNWIAYEWLGDVAIAEAYRLGHLQGLRLLQWILAAILLVLLYAYAAIRCENSKAAFAACAIVVPIIAGFWSLRPQLFGYIFFLIVLIVLERFRQGRAWTIWLLPAVFAAWVNTHGTFAFGFLAIGIAWICGVRRHRFSAIESHEWTKPERLQIVLATLASVLSLLLTPYGSKLAAYPFDIGFLQPANVANIQEWMPITSQRFLTLTVLALLLAFMLAKILLRFSCRLDDLALLSVAATTTFLHLRFVPLFLIVTVPLLALPLARWFSVYNPERDRPVINAALVLVLGLGVIWYFPSNSELSVSCATYYPTAAVEHLKGAPKIGNIFNEYGWGGFLEWSHFPPKGVFIDGRADVFERAGVFSDYLSVARLEPNALRILDKYDIETCLIRSDSPLATLLAASPAWQLSYLDDVSAVYTRREKPSSEPVALPPQDISPRSGRSILVHPSLLLFRLGFSKGW
ncbi:MAG TPA: hypothetical protein VMH00_02470 [Candidatus Limnocylindrales bacterium]|nr:hypothetical protein [Candidatus Limnocylindrales bacterium]